MTSLTVLFVLLLILTGNTLLRTVASVVGGELPKDLIFSLMGVNALRQSVILVPMSFFLGVVLVMGRLYQDSEMAAITSGGLGILGLYKKLLWVIIPLSIVLFALALFVNAWAIEQREVIWKDAERRVEITALSPGKFNTNSRNDMTIFFDQYSEGTALEKQRIENIFLQLNRGDNEIIQIADTANKHVDPLTGSVYMQYKKGQLYVDNDKGFTLLEFEEHGVFLKEKVYPVSSNKDVDAMSFKQLWGSTDIRHIAELQMRFAVPLGSILFILLAIPLSRTAPRKGRYSRLGYSILLYFFYFYLLNLAHSWVESGKLPTFPGVFIVIIGIACILFFCVASQEGWLYKKPQKRQQVLP